MPLLLVTYQINSHLDPEGDFVEAIEFYEYTKLNEMAYVIETKERPQIIFDELTKFLEPSDTLVICKIKPPWYGRGHMDMIDWVSKKI